MNGYDLYCTYQAIKLHFSSEQYNFFHYDGKTRVSIDAFQKRRDKFLFHRLARKYRDDEMVPFLVANFVHSDDNWTKSLLEEEAEQTYREWKRTTDSMSKIYAEDLQKIATKVFIYASVAFGVIGILLILIGTDQGKNNSVISETLAKLLYITVFIILPSFALSVAGKYLKDK